MAREGTALLLLAGGGLLLLTRGTAHAMGTAPRAAFMTWPIDPASVTRLGDTAGDRGGEHQGLDIMGPAGQPVVAPVPGRVLRVVNGSASAIPSRRRAGQWVDLQAGADFVVPHAVLRMLHLRPGDIEVEDGDQVERGATLGYIAEPGTSGVDGKTPAHVHFEIRRPGTGGKGGYGEPVDPLSVLPPTGIDRFDRRLGGVLRG